MKTIDKTILHHNSGLYHLDTLNRIERSKRSESSEQGQPSTVHRQHSTSRTIDSGITVGTETCEEITLHSKERSSNISGNIRIANRMTESRTCSTNVRYKTIEEIGRDLRQAIQENDLDKVTRLIPTPPWPMGFSFARMTDSNGNSPLHLAVIKGNKDIVTIMLTRAGSIAGLYLKNVQKEAPIHIAIDKGHSDIAKLLINSMWNINPLGSRGTPLHLAIINNNEELVREILNRRAFISVAVNMKDPQGNSPLHLAVNSGNDNIVRHLLEKGANVNVLDAQGRTPRELALTENNHLADLLIME